ncbi:MAG TPA: dihydrofolate reductase family protein [Thermoleophilaceae bacterium]|jgi:dihydrofolate reductase
MAVTFSISVSVDGYVAGPNQGTDHPLGEGGEALHDWALPLRTFREGHGREGGETGPDDDVLRETFERPGAAIMGRKMFGGGPGPWDESWKGWWDDDPPFRYPVFVLTHHPREPLVFDNGTTFTFVTDGIESALEQARAAAGERDVQISGGAQAIQQYLAAGHVDDFQLSVAPVMLGGGERLFEAVPPLDVEIDRVVATPNATHLRYRVRR